MTRHQARELGSARLRGELPDELTLLARGPGDLAGHITTNDRSHERDSEEQTCQEPVRQITYLLSSCQARRNSSNSRLRQIAEGDHEDIDRRR